MNEKQQENMGPETLLGAWMKSTNESWGSMARMWLGTPGTAEIESPSKKGHKGRVQESMESALKMWQTLSSTMSEPGAMNSLLQGINALPEIFLNMAQTGWNRYFQLQQQWMERAGSLGQRTEAYKFENLDEEVFKAWTEIYEEEFRKFLYAPQLGLTRFYQERTGRLTDGFNLFQGAVAEFMYLLYLPMEKSFQVMQEKLEEVTEEGKLPESSQDYYRMWLRVLEGHYMTLFKSPEYTQVLSKALDAMADFTMARQESLQDVLQMFPVPTNKDMDELYKELYSLKKKIKQFEKKVDKHEVPKVD